MNKIFVLGAGQMQVPIIKKVKERGDYCIVADFDKYAPGMKYADVALSVSTMIEMPYWLQPGSMLLMGY